MEDSQKQIGWFHGLREQLRSFDVRMPRALEDINCKALAKDLRDNATLTGMSANGRNLEKAYFEF